MRTISSFAAFTLALVVLPGALPARADTVWPLETFNRQLTMPAGTFQAGFNVTGAPTTDAMGETTLFDTYPTALVAAYGISNALEVTATYGLALEDFEGKGPLRTGVGYAALRGAAGGKLEVIARAEVGYDLLAEEIAPITIGPQLQYNLTSKVALVSPSQFSSWLTITVDGDDDGTGGTIAPITLDLPIGGLYQATPNIFLQLDTKLASFGISDADSAFLGADFVPVNLTLGYTPVNRLDVALILGDDLVAASDTFGATLFLRYYGI